MGFFSFLGRKKRPEIVHSVFGRIVYQYDDTWELGRVQFAPLGKELEVVITAGPEGPDDRHTQFLSELVARWPELKRAWEPLLREALREWIDAPDRGDIWLRLDVEGIDIFPGLRPDQEWEFTFWCKEASHWPTIAMKGWTPQSCFIDG